MKGDKSRETFHKEKHYSSVRQQQGRVQVDADWNEQAEIQQNHDTNEAIDVIGRFGAPEDNPGFGVTRVELQGHDGPELRLSKGRIYIDGIQVELFDPPRTWYMNRYYGYRRQEFHAHVKYPHLNFSNEAPGTFVVYLDVWERHVSWAEDASIREVALGGPDTATRAQNVWQVEIARKPYSISDLYPRRDRLMKADVERAPVTTDLCSPAPTSGYRGLENQLYRVEIHQGGGASQATYKWSRDNGSVVARWLGPGDLAHSLRVEVAGGDASQRFAPGVWVELTCDERELDFMPGVLVEVTSVHDNIIEYDPNTVQLPSDLTGIDFREFDTNPRLRRWDSAGALPASNAQNGWLDLENGIQIQFSGEGESLCGDYWTIPARTATRDIDWEYIQIAAGRMFKHAEGIEHHIGILAEFTWDGEDFSDPVDQRPLFPPLTRIRCDTELPKPGQYRCYQVDPVGGNDETAVVGISDTSLAESVSRGGVHRFKTFAGVSARFPRLGNDSYATILVSANGDDGNGNYYMALSLERLIGYRDVMIRASDLTGSDADWQNCSARQLTEFVVVEAIAGGNLVYVNLAPDAPTPELGSAWRGARVTLPPTDDGPQRTVVDGILAGPSGGDVVADYQLVMAGFVGRSGMPVALQPYDRILIETQGVSMPALVFSGTSCSINVVGIKINTRLVLYGANDYSLAFVYAWISGDGGGAGNVSLNYSYYYCGVGATVGPCATMESSMNKHASVSMARALAYNLQVFNGVGRVNFTDCRICTERNGTDQFLENGVIMYPGQLELQSGSLSGTIRLIGAHATMHDVYLEPVPMNMDSTHGAILPPEGGDRIIRMCGVGPSLIAEGLTGYLGTHSIFVSMLPSGLRDVQSSALATSYNGTFMLSQCNIPSIAWVEMADGVQTSNAAQDLWDANGNHFGTGFPRPQCEHGFTLLVSVEPGVTIQAGTVVRLVGNAVRNATATETSNIIGVCQHYLSNSNSGVGAAAVTLPIHVVTSGCVQMAMAGPDYAVPAVVYTGADGTATTSSAGSRIGVLMQLVDTRLGLVKLG